VIESGTGRKENKEKGGLAEFRFTKSRGRTVALSRADGGLSKKGGDFNTHPAAKDS